MPFQDIAFGEFALVELRLSAFAEMTGLLKQLQWKDSGVTFFPFFRIVFQNPSKILPIF